MSIECASCGQDNREGSRYCLRCGSELDADGEDLLLGRMIHGRYRVRTIIGQGGMGRVYLAEQQLGTAKRDVAIKVLHGKLGRDERVRQRFYRECEVVVQLTHPNTIHFFDFGELDDGRLFIVMEYIDGPTLADELTRGPMPLERVDHLLSQIVGSLHEAHDKGVVHRDLKPDNVMLTHRGGEDDFVKVCDFGIAHQHGEGPEITIEGTVIGTPQYMSPEQLSGGKVDSRSDVYSLGLILFEMLTGQRPFEAATPLQWATLHTTAEPPSLGGFEATRGLPAHRAEAVMAALAKKPADRPPTARALAEAFLGHPVGRLTTPRSSPPTGRASRLETAPTALETPLVATPADEPLKPAGVRSPLTLIGGFLIFVGVLASAVAAFLQRDTLAALVDPGAGAASADAGPPLDAGTAPPDPVPVDWLRIVHFQRRIEDAALSLGPPDQRYAVIPPTGTLVLELRAGTRIASDGASGPEVALVVDEERSGPYRADLGEDRHEYTTVGSELFGSLELDSDQFDITRVRYIRLKNRGDIPVYLDAVGVYDTVRVRD